MGYLDNSSITVDAVLTKKGRDILKNGGSLEINSFTLSDTGVDYSLFNPSHPDGSAKYGIAIENLPQLEASVHAEYHLRNRLLTLSKNAVSVPHLKIAGEVDTNGRTITFADVANANKSITIQLSNYNYNLNLSPRMYMVIQDINIIKPLNLTESSNLSGTSELFLTKQDIPYAAQFDIPENNGTITLQPQPQLDGVTGRQTNIFIVDRETGISNSIVAINNVTEELTPLINQNQNLLKCLLILILLNFMDAFD